MSHKYSNSKLSSLIFLIRNVPSQLINLIQIILTSLFANIQSPTQFKYNNQLLNTFKHPYNRTSLNERIIEIPIFQHIIQKYTNAKILEVGAVMQHYQSINWPVIDKFEVGKAIINCDILNYQTTQKFDLIISISTIEHLGLDDDEIDPNKPINAIKYLQSLLKPNGLLYISLPSGYNTALDTYLQNEGISSKNIDLFQRSSWSNNWVQIYATKIPSIKFGYPYNNANMIMILKITNQTKII